MSKFVGIKTYERFRNLWENNEINEFSLNFILDTGQLYTHGIFINGAVFGTVANGAVPLTIAGTTNTLALSSHTHSNYLEKNKDIDISNYKIISGDNDLLYCNGGSLYIGNSNPTYISGSLLYHVDDSNTYTILDTGNFEITNTLASGYTYNNTALIKYGSNSHLIDYVKRINTSLSFDYLNTYTLAGTNLLNGVYYGYLTLYTDNIYTNPSWAQLRINISEKVMLYRTSADSNNWISVTDSTAVKLGTAGATNITNGSIISTLSSNGIIFQGGTNSFKVGDGTKSINVSVNHGLSTKDISINDSNYAIYTSANSLPTILAPTSYGSANQILATNSTGDGLTWVNKPTSNVTTTAVISDSSTGKTNITTDQNNPYYNLIEGSTVKRSILFKGGLGISINSNNGIITFNNIDNTISSTLSNVDLTSLWSNVEDLTTKLENNNGSYIILITYGSRIYTGYFSYVSDSSGIEEEILLHCSGKVESSPLERGRLYAKIGLNSSKVYLQLATTLNESNATVTIKYKKVL